MKITKAKLKQIIKEELDSTLAEGGWGYDKYWYKNKQDENGEWYKEWYPAVEEIRKKIVAMEDGEEMWKVLSHEIPPSTFQTLERTLEADDAEEKIKYEYGKRKRAQEWTGKAIGRGDFGRLD